MSRFYNNCVDEASLTTLCPICLDSFQGAKGVRVRRADPKQKIKDVCTYCQIRYREMLSVLVDAWCGDSDSFLSGILHGMARFLALYQGEHSRERLVGRLRTVHPKTITRLAQNDTGNMADRHMKQILSIYNGAGRVHSLPCKR